MKTLTGEKPFACHDSDKAFKTKSVLIKRFILCAFDFKYASPRWWTHESTPTGLRRNSSILTIYIAWITKVHIIHTCRSHAKTCIWCTGRGWGWAMICCIHAGKPTVTHAYAVPWVVIIVSGSETLTHTNIFYRNLNSFQCSILNWKELSLFNFPE